MKSFETGEYSVTIWYLVATKMFQRFHRRVDSDCDILETKELIPMRQMEKLF